MTICGVPRHDHAAASWAQRDMSDRLALINAGIPHDKAQQWCRQSLCGASPSMQPAAPADKA
jgi:hypothetical protein